MSAIRIRVAVTVALALLGASLVVAGTPSPAEAANPCAAKAQNNFTLDIMYGQDPSLGCSQMMLSYEYWAGSQGFIYEGQFFYLTQGHTVHTYSFAQLSRGKACTSNSVSPDCTYSSGWWNHSNWTTFG